MTDQELRSLVRDAVARHLGGASAAEPRPNAGLAHPPAQVSAHASHGKYLTLVNAGGACLIEPAVSCNHCGYCLSHGH